MLFGIDRPPNSSDIKVPMNYPPWAPPHPNLPLPQVKATAVNHMMTHNSTITMWCAGVSHHVLC